MNNATLNSTPLNSGGGIISSFLDLPASVSVAQAQFNDLTAGVSVAASTFFDGIQASVTVAESDKVDANASVVVSNYKWMTSTLLTAQQSQTLRPYFQCTFVDDSVVPNQIFTNPNQPVNGQIVTAPDGALLVCGKVSNGNLGFWKITDGTNLANWTASPTIVIETNGNWDGNRNSSVAVSGYINGTYTIDVYYWTASLGSYFINRRRSIDGGSTFSGSISTANTGVVSPTSANVFLAGVAPQVQDDGTTDGMVFYIRDPSGANQYQINYFHYPGTGSVFSARTQWSTQTINSNDWSLHSLDAILHNNIYYIVFSGYHTGFEDTNGQYSLYSTKLLKHTNATATDIWTPSVSIVASLSSSTQNQNTFLYPRLNFDGSLLWLTYQGIIVDTIKEDGTITTKTNFFTSQSQDFENYTYLSPLISNDGIEFEDTAQNSFAMQGSYYYLGGNGQLWQFIQDDFVADVTDDIIKYQVQENAGGLSSISMTIQNANNKWVGPSPTGVGYQAFAKNKKIYLYQGYYNASGVGETIPRNTYYIDDIQQMVNSNSNNLIIQARDIIKKMKVTTSRFSSNFEGPNYYIDTFDGTTIGNWNQKLGAWTESGNIFSPSTMPSVNDFITTLSGINITKFSTLFEVIVTLPTISNAAVYIYPFWKDASNWIRLRIVFNGSNYDWFTEYMIAGTPHSGSSASGVNMGGVGATIPIFCRSVNYNIYYFMFGDNIATGVNAFNFSTLLGVPIVLNTTTGIIGTIVTVALGCNGYTAQFSNLKFVQYSNSQSLKELLISLGTKAGIFNYVFENNVEEYMYDLSRWTGTYTAPNRTLAITANNFALLNSQQVDNGEIEFDAKFTPTDPTQNYGGGLVFRSQASNSISQCYEFDAEKKLDTDTNSIITAKFKIRTLTGYDGYPNTSPTLLMSSAAEYSFPSPGIYPINNLLFDLTTWHHYKVTFFQGWFMAFIDGVMVVAWYDNNKDQTYSTGYIGFRANANTEIQVKNVIGTTFYNQVSQFGINPGTDFEDPSRSAIQIVRGWFMTDLFGRLKSLVLSNADLPNYSYDTQLISQQVNNSDVEYQNQVTVVGLGVTAVARDNVSIGQTLQTRDAIITDYKITTLKDAQDRANYELINFNKFNNQSTPTQYNNVGSELFDVVHITNTGANSSGVDEDVRIYSEQVTMDGPNGAYSVNFGTGKIA